MTLMKFKWTGLSAAAIAVVMAASTGAVQAQSVKLKANDGSASIQGRLLEFSDGFYRVETDLGVLRLSAARMICEGEGCPQIGSVNADLTFAGSDTIGDGIMPLLLSGYAYSMGAEAEVQNGPQANTVVAELVSEGGFGDPIGSYLIQTTTTDDAFVALREGRADIGMSARRIRPVEARALRDAGAGNMTDVRQERIVAVDPVTVIVNQANPVQSLTMDQLAGIYSGQITNWAEVGGVNMPITVHSRTEGSGTREFFLSRVLRNQADETPDAVLTNDHNEMAAAINSNQGGIGFVGYAFQRGAKPLSLVKSCGITTTPSPFTSKTEEYPLDRRLYLYTTENALNEEVEKILQYATSSEADGVIAKAGFIDLGIERVAQDQTGGRMRDLIQNTSDPYELSLMREMLLEMLRWERLSTTLRFATGSRALDERGEADLVRLIDYLAQQPAGTEVALVGFTDGDGAFEGNRQLALSRASQVAVEIEQRAGNRLQDIRFSAFGFGELSPAACNDTADGKRVNRRVEIWIRGGAAVSLIAQ